MKYKALILLVLVNDCFQCLASPTQHRFNLGKLKEISQENVDTPERHPRSPDDPQPSWRPSSRKELELERNKRRCDRCKELPRCKIYGRCDTCKIYCRDIDPIAQPTQDPVEEINKRASEVSSRAPEVSSSKLLGSSQCQICRSSTPCRRFGLCEPCKRFCEEKNDEEEQEQEQEEEEVEGEEEEETNNVTSAPENIVPTTVQESESATEQNPASMSLCERCKQSPLCKRFGACDFCKRLCETSEESNDVIGKSLTTTEVPSETTTELQPETTTINNNIVGTGRLVLPDSVRTKAIDLVAEIRKALQNAQHQKPEIENLNNEDEQPPTNTEEYETVNDNAEANADGENVGSPIVSSIFLGNLQEDSTTSAPEEATTISSRLRSASSSGDKQMISFVINDEKETANTSVGLPGTAVRYYTVGAFRPGLKMNVLLKLLNIQRTDNIEKLIVIAKTRAQRVAKDAGPPVIIDISKLFTNQSTIEVNRGDGNRIDGADIALTEKLDKELQKALDKKKEMLGESRLTPDEIDRIIENVTSTYNQTKTSSMDLLGQPTTNIQTEETTISAILEKATTTADPTLVSHEAPTLASRISPNKENDLPSLSSQSLVKETSTIVSKKHEFENIQTSEHTHHVGAEDNSLQQQKESEQIIGAKNASEDNENLVEKEEEEKTPEFQVVGDPIETQNEDKEHSVGDIQKPEEEIETVSSKHKETTTETIIRENWTTEMSSQDSKSKLMETYKQIIEKDLKGNTALNGPQEENVQKEVSKLLESALESAPKTKSANAESEALEKLDNSLSKIENIVEKSPDQTEARKSEDETLGSKAPSSSLHLQKQKTDAIYVKQKPKKKTDPSGKTEHPSEKVSDPFVVNAVEDSTPLVSTVPTPTVTERQPEKQNGTDNDPLKTIIKEVEKIPDYIMQKFGRLKTAEGQGTASNASSDDSASQNLQQSADLVESSTTESNILKETNAVTEKTENEMEQRGDSALDERMEDMIRQNTDRDDSNASVASDNRFAENEDVGETQQLQEEEEQEQTKADKEVSGERMDENVGENADTLQTSSTEGNVGMEQESIDDKSVGEALGDDINKQDGGSLDNSMSKHTVFTKESEIKKNLMEQSKRLSEMLHKNEVEDSTSPAAINEEDKKVGGSQTLKESNQGRLAEGTDSDPAIVESGESTVGENANKQVGSTQDGTMGKHAVLTKMFEIEKKLMKESKRLGEMLHKNEVKDGSSPSAVDEEDKKVGDSQTLKESNQDKLAEGTESDPAIVETGESTVGDDVNKQVGRTQDGTMGKHTVLTKMSEIEKKLMEESKRLGEVLHKNEVEDGSSPTAVDEEDKEVEDTLKETSQDKQADGGTDSDPAIVETDESAVGDDINKQSDESQDNMMGKHTVFTKKSDLKKKLIEESKRFSELLHKNEVEDENNPTSVDEEDKRVGDSQTLKESSQEKQAEGTDSDLTILEPGENKGLNEDSSGALLQNEEEEEQGPNIDASTADLTKQSENVGNTQETTERMIVEQIDKSSNNLQSRQEAEEEAEGEDEEIIGDTHQTTKESDERDAGSVSSSQSQSSEERIPISTVGDVFSGPVLEKQNEDMQIMPILGSDSQTKPLAAQAAEQKDLTHFVQDNNANNVLQTKHFSHNNQQTSSSTHHQNGTKQQMDWAFNQQSTFFNSEEASHHFGKIIPSRESSAIVQHNFQQPISKVYFIGDNVKLPLKVKHNSDGSVHLTLDAEKMCKCKEKTCTDNHETSHTHLGKVVPADLHDSKEGSAEFTSLPMGEKLDTDENASSGIGDPRNHLTFDDAHVGTSHQSINFTEESVDGMNPKSSLGEADSPLKQNNKMESIEDKEQKNALPDANFAEEIEMLGAEHPRKEVKRQTDVLNNKRNSIFKRSPKIRNLYRYLKIDPDEEDSAAQVEEVKTTATPAMDDYYLSINNGQDEDNYSVKFNQFGNDESSVYHSKPHLNGNKNIIKHRVGLVTDLLSWMKNLATDTRV